MSRPDEDDDDDVLEDEESEEGKHTMSDQTKDPSLKVWIYIVLLHPTKYARHRGEMPKVIVPLGAVLAKDEADAAVQIGPLIPEEHRGLGDRVEVSVRPF